jgi:hypothetical protein
MNQRTLWMLLATMQLGGCAASSPPVTREISVAPATVSYRLSRGLTRFEHATVEEVDSTSPPTTASLTARSQVVPWKS